MEETEYQLAISCQQIKLPVVELLHSIELLTKDSHGNPPKSQAIAKAIVCFSQTDNRDEDKT